MYDNNQHRKLWENAEYDKLGHQLAQNLPGMDKPAWYAMLLELCLEYHELEEPFTALIEIASKGYRWKEARDVFNKLRYETIKCEKDAIENNRRYCLLLLAENIAKTISNSPVPVQGGFDVHAEYAIPHCVKDILDTMQDEQSKNDIIQYLLSEPRF